MPPLFIGTALLAITLLIVALMVGNDSGWSWIYPLVLLAVVQGANSARQRERFQLAAWLLSGAYSVLPVLTVPLFGVHSNPLVYLAALGAAIAALTLSANAAAFLACGTYVLKHVGRYSVRSVASGPEAIEAALADTPDLIILDISMAGMDGVTTLHELRQRGVACSAIAFTARTERTPGEFKNHGFSAYVSKTGDLSSLLETVRAVLSSRAHGTSSYAPVA